MIPGAGKSPSCFKRKSQVMRQHRESCTIDQQQEAHSLCLKKKQKTPKKEPAGSSSGTLLTAGRFFTEESSGGAALCRVQALLGCARSLVWENQGEKRRKKQGKTGEFGSGVPKRSWLLGSAAHSCPTAFPCHELFHLEGQTSRHTEGILLFQVQERRR